MSNPGSERSVFQKLLHHTKQLFILLIVCLIAFSGMWRYGNQSPEVFTTSIPHQHVTKKPSPYKPMYPYLIEEDQKCSDGAPFLLLLIASIPEEASTRDAVRRTWANETLVNGVTIMRLFLLGRPSRDDIQDKVILESNQFHDIIQQDFVDSYFNLTVKVLMGIEWVSRLCPNASYIMKTDTDMFINPWILVHEVLQPAKPVKVKFYTGKVITGAPAIRNKASKFYVTESVYPKKFYPTYCTGSGYIFSGSLAEKIYKQSQHLQIFPFEDVFVGMCLQKEGIRVSKPPTWRFQNRKLQYNRCQFASLVFVHHFTPDELLKLWPDFSTARDICERQHILK